MASVPNAARRACSAQPCIMQSQITHVVVSDTEYYLSGPQQPRPLEGTLPAGTTVTLLEEAGAIAGFEARMGSRRTSRPIACSF